jgi:hypothetical protein
MDCPLAKTPQARRNPGFIPGLEVTIGLLSPRYDSTHSTRLPG